MKWNHIISPCPVEGDGDEESDEEIQQLKQRIRIRRRERMKEVYKNKLEIIFSLKIVCVDTDMLLFLLLTSTPYRMVHIKDCLLVTGKSSPCSQVRSECLTCTFRTSCCSARLSWALCPGQEKKGEGIRGDHLHWWVRGSMSSLIGIGSRWRLV